jgi:hypothetical protein
VYNPEVFKDNDDICFKIFYNNMYLWSECNMYACEYDGSDDNWDNLKYCPIFSDITEHHQTITPLSEVDIHAIIKYINDTEFTILTKRRLKSTYVPYNYPIICQTCEKCRNNKKLNYL